MKWYDRSLFIFALGAMWFFVGWQLRGMYDAASGGNHQERATVQP